MKGLVPVATAAAVACCSLAATTPVGAELFRGTNRSERITGTDDADTIKARGGNDRVRALGGDDVVYAGRGRDIASGGTGNDLLSGGRGTRTDRLYGNLGVDTCVGGEKTASCIKPY